MTEREKFTKWFLQQKEENGMVDLKYFNGDLHDCSTEEYFAELNAMNEAETVDVPDYTENFPRYDILEALAPVAMDKAIAAGRAKPFKFNDATTKKNDT